MTYFITMNDWKRHDAKFDWHRKYLGNVVAVKDGEHYDLPLTADDICCWMEAEVDDMIYDGKLTKDTTDNELNAEADRICVEYINADIGDYAMHHDFQALDPEEIAWLYRYAGLDTLIYNWLITSRDNMREEE